MQKFRSQNSRLCSCFCCSDLTFLVTYLATYFRWKNFPDMEMMRINLWRGWKKFSWHEIWSWVEHTRRVARDYIRVRILKKLPHSLFCVIIELDDDGTFWKLMYKFLVWSKKSVPVDGNLRPLNGESMLKMFNNEFEHFFLQSLECETFRQQPWNQNSLFAHMIRKHQDFCLWC